MVWPKDAGVLDMSTYRRFLRAYYIMFFWVLRLVGCLGFAVNLIIITFVLADVYGDGRKYGYSGLVFVVVSLVWFFVTLKVGSIGLVRLRQKSAS